MIDNAEDLKSQYKADWLFYESPGFYFEKSEIIKLRKLSAYEHYIKDKLQES